MINNLDLRRFLYNKVDAKKVAELKKCKIDEQGDISWNSFVKPFFKRKVFSSETEYFAFLIDNFLCNDMGYQYEIYGMGCTIEENGRKKLYVPHYNPEISGSKPHLSYYYSIPADGGDVFDLDKDGKPDIREYRKLSTEENVVLLLANQKNMRELSIPEQEFLLLVNKTEHKDSPVKEARIKEVEDLQFDICSIEEINGIVREELQDSGKEEDFLDDYFYSYDGYEYECYPFACCLFANTAYSYLLKLPTPTVGLVP